MDGDCQRINLPLVYSRRGVRKINTDSNTLLWAIFIECYYKQHHIVPVDKKQFQNYPLYNKYKISLEKFTEKYDLYHIKGDDHISLEDFSIIEDNIPDIKLNVYKTDYTHYTLTNNIVLPNYITPIYRSKYSNDTDSDRHEINILKLYDMEWDPEYNDKIISNIFSRLSINIPEDDCERDSRKCIYVCIEDMDKFSKLAKIGPPSITDSIKEEPAACSA